MNKFPLWLFIGVMVASLVALYVSLRTVGFLHDLCFVLFVALFFTVMGMAQVQR